MILAFMENLLWGLQSKMKMRSARRGPDGDEVDATDIETGSRKSGPHNATGKRKLKCAVRNMPT
jgi:hypothetical protein